MFGNKNAKVCIHYDKQTKEYIVSRGYIPKNSKNIKDCPDIMHFGSKKDAIAFGNKWLKSRGKNDKI